MREMGRGSYNAIAKALPTAFKRLELVPHVSCNTSPAASMKPEDPRHDIRAKDNVNLISPEARSTKDNASKPVPGHHSRVQEPETALGPSISQGAIEEAVRRMASEIISELRKSMSDLENRNLISEIRKLQDQLTQFATSHATASGVDGNTCEINWRLDALEEESRQNRAALNNIQHDIMYQGSDLISRTVAQQELYESVGRVQVDMAR